MPNQEFNSFSSISSSPPLLNDFDSPKQILFNNLNLQKQQINNNNKQQQQKQQQLKEKKKLIKKIYSIFESTQFSIFLVRKLSKAFFNSQANGNTTDKIERATKSGIAAEAFQKVQSKFEPILAHEILEWIATITRETFNTDGDVGNFFQILQDGTLLCKLANALAPDSIKKINSSQMAFKKMENISFFLEFAAKYVSKSEIFQTVDLYENQDPNAVLVCLSALARKSNEAFGKPSIGPKESKGEKREWTREQLYGEGTIGLQMGSNKGASQSGMIIGNTRHM